MGAILGLFQVLASFDLIPLQSGFFYGLYYGYFEHSNFSPCRVTGSARQEDILWLNPEKDSNRYRRSEFFDTYRDKFGGDELPDGHPPVVYVIFWGNKEDGTGHNGLYSAEVVVGELFLMKHPTPHISLLLPLILVLVAVICTMVSMKYLATHIRIIDSGRAMISNVLLPLGTLVEFIWLFNLLFIRC
jgi:hypothetical protein